MGMNGSYLPLKLNMFGFMGICFAPSRKHCYDLILTRVPADVSYFLFCLSKNDFSFSQRK